jgi:hypothetical protein
MAQKLEDALNTKTAIMAGQQLYIARLEAQLDSLNRDVGKLLLLSDLQKDIKDLSACNRGTAHCIYGNDAHAICMAMK